MAFVNSVSVIGTSDNTIFTFPAGFEGAVHALMINNPSGSPETITIKIFNQLTGTTVNSLVKTVAAGEFYTYPKPIDFSSLDKLILISSGAASVVSTSIYTQGVSGAPTALVLNPRGAWDTNSSYIKLDMVDVSGSSYVCINPNNANTPPSVNWGVVANNGAGALSNLVEDLSPQLGADLDSNNFALRTSSYLQAADASVGSGTHTFDYTAGDGQQITATGNFTVAFSGFPTGKICSYMIDAVNWGDHTITLPSGMLFDAATVPTFTSSGTDRLVIIKDKDEVYGMLIAAQGLAVSA